MDHLTTPLIYNLFPRLVGSIDQWPNHAARAAALGFNWLYLNPFHLPGLSGSLYAIKDYDRLNPAFLPDRGEEGELHGLLPVLRDIASFGIHPMVDLVINHTAIDAPLVQAHPEWYIRNEKGIIQSPYAVDPCDATKKTVWGDLAEIDNYLSPDRDQLWAFWARVVETYLELGFEGFRCDAAYKVPADLWCFLMERASRVNPHAVFWAENLGCTVEQTRELRKAGFHFFCNSLKWWDFQQSWCLDQHAEFEDLPSISFPETHDTERLAKESGGSEAVQRQRYALAATFSAGVLMPIGYEFGFQKTLHVVKTHPSDWETPLFDLSAFVKAVNHFKLKTPLFQGEGSLQRIEGHQQDILVLERQSSVAPGQRGWIMMNTHAFEPRETDSEIFKGASSDRKVVRLSQLDHLSETTTIPPVVKLNPAEVIVVM